MVKPEFTRELTGTSIVKRPISSLLIDLDLGIDNV